MKSFGSAGASANQLVLLRDANGDGIAEGKSVLIAHVDSPFGVTWVDGNLYVAGTDGVLRYPFTPGQTPQFRE